MRNFFHLVKAFLTIRLTMACKRSSNCQGYANHLSKKNQSIHKWQPGLSFNTKLNTLLENVSQLSLSHLPH